MAVTCPGLRDAHCVRAANGALQHRPAAGLTPGSVLLITQILVFLSAARTDQRLA